MAADYKRVTDFSTAMQIYDVATDAEKRLIYREARNKVFAARSKPYEWNNPDGSPDQATRAIAAKYFHVKPLAPHAAPPPSPFPSPQPIQ